MTTPQLIYIQTARPKPGFDGAIAQGYFVHEGTRVTLTSADGRMLRDPEGRDYVEELKDGATPREAAVRLLKRFRLRVRGDRPSGFDGPLKYPPLKY